MIVGPKTDQRAERGEQQGQGEHHADEGGGYLQFDDHHPIEGSDQQHEGHADGDLKQGKPQEPAQG